MAWYDKLAKAGTAFLQGFGDELPRAQARHQQNEARRDQKTQRELDRIQKQFEFLPQSEREGFITQLRERGEAVPEYAQLADELAARTRGRAAELSSAYDLALTQTSGTLDTAATEEVAPAPGFGGLDPLVESRQGVATRATQAVGQARTAATATVGQGGTITPEQQARAQQLETRAADLQRRNQKTQALRNLFHSMRFMPTITEETVEKAQNLWSMADLDPEAFDGWFNSWRADHTAERDRRALGLLSGLTHEASAEYIDDLIAGASAEVGQTVVQTWKALRGAHERAMTDRDAAMQQQKTEHFMRVHTLANESLWEGLQEGRFDAIDNAAMIYRNAGFDGMADTIVQNANSFKLAAKENKVSFLRDRAAAEFTGSFASQAGRNAAMPGMDGKPVDFATSLLDYQQNMSRLLSAMYPESKAEEAGAEPQEVLTDADDIVSASRATDNPAVLVQQVTREFERLTPAHKRALRTELFRRSNDLHPQVAAALGIPQGTATTPAATDALGVLGGPTSGVSRPYSAADPGANPSAIPAPNPGMAPRAGQAAGPGRRPAPAGVPSTDRPSGRAQVQQGGTGNPATPRALTELGPRQGMTKRMRDAINRQRALRGLPPLTTPVR